MSPLSFSLHWINTFNLKETRFDKKVLYCGKETCSLFHSFVSLHLFCIYFFVIKVLQFDSLFFLFFDLPYNADCTGVVLCMYSRIHTT